MPTNLPPEYFEIDKRYRAAATNEERIALLEELISTIPKHKGTERLRGDYKARLAKLRYDSGAARYLEVLDAERELLAVEQQLVQTRRAWLAAQVALYTALGGGSAHLAPAAGAPIERVRPTP